MKHGPELSFDDDGQPVLITRAAPAYEETQEVREVEALFFDAIDRATRTIYIENQFLTASRLALHLAKRMQQQPELEVVLIVPKAHHSWLETHVMRAGRVRFMRIIEAAGMVSTLAPAHRTSAVGRDLHDALRESYTDRGDGRTSQDWAQKVSAYGRTSSSCDQAERCCVCRCQ